MSRHYTVADLEAWEDRIHAIVDRFGLKVSRQEFDICDRNQFLGLMAYHGMPAHYPHWSYGKAYERQKTLYDHGLSGLPYELVINTDPCLAYLMQDNTLAVQVLTIAHVYGHNDFFRNNVTFRATAPANVIAGFKARSDRVRHYREDPAVGAEAIERVVDAAHALAFHCEDEFPLRRPATDSPAGATELDEPENAGNLLLFIRDNGPHLSPWQKDVLTVVHGQSLYFLPQMKTKIMNEGWASYWHWRILDALGLPHDLHLEFLVRHNQVLAPVPGTLNPYHLGLAVWEDIEHRYDEAVGAESDLPDAGKTGRQKIFEVREEDHDISFLRRFLTKDLARRIGLFEYSRQGSVDRVTRVPTDADWPAIKETLMCNIGTAGIPVIRAADADYGRWHALYLRHVHDGRDLHREYAEKTLSQINELWGRRVILETRLDCEPRFLIYDDGHLEVATRAG